MPRVPTLTRVADDTPPARVATNLAGQQSPIPSASSQASRSTSRHLLDVSPQILMGHRAWVSAGPWQGVFDCALWLRTPQGIQQPLQLVLRYLDNQGEKIVTIDRCAAGAYRTVLLNGSVMLSVAGRVRELSFNLVNASATMEILVDEWHMVPQQRR